MDDELKMESYGIRLRATAKQFIPQTRPKNSSRKVNRPVAQLQYGSAHLSRKNNALVFSNGVIQRLLRMADDEGRISVLLEEARH